MSCACEQKKLSMELERIRRLAKNLAQIEQEEVILFKNPDGTYGFTCSSEIDNDKTFIEYISPY